MPPRKRSSFHVQNFPRDLRVRIVHTAQLRCTTAGELMVKITEEWFAKQERLKNRGPLATIT